MWGKIVLYLRENKLIALHVACGDISDVVLENNKLIIRNSDDFLIRLLEDGRKDLENAIRWQGLNLELVIKKEDSKDQKMDRDIEKLKRLVGTKFSVKE